MWPNGRTLDNARMHGTTFKVLTILLRCAVIIATANTEISDRSTAAVATISTLLVVVIIMVGVYFTVQISYKLATRKKRYCCDVFIIIKYDMCIQCHM